MSAGRYASIRERKLAMYINKTEIKVRYVETDQMGIVHHSNYYAWFEVGRGTFIADIGLSYKELEERGILLPVLESSCKYIEGAQYDDDLVIQTWIEEINGAKIMFQYDVVRKKDHKVIAKGRTKHAFVNKEFRLLNAKKNMPDVWGKLEKLS
jgi:acyl-CoA thioester hydrolase